MQQHFGGLLVALRIRHGTTYGYRRPVSMGPHRLMLRPRESRDLRLISSEINVTSAGVLRWKKQLGENESAGGGVNEKIVPLYRRPDDARYDDAPHFRRASGEQFVAPNLLRNTHDSPQSPGARPWRATVSPVPQRGRRCVQASFTRLNHGVPFDHPGNSAACRRVQTNSNEDSPRSV